MAVASVTFELTSLSAGPQGCTVAFAENYSPTATEEDGSWCVSFPPPGHPAAALFHRTPHATATRLFDSHSPRESCG